METAVIALGIVGVIMYAVKRAIDLNSANSLFNIFDNEVIEYTYHYRDGEKILCFDVKRPILFGPRGVRTDSLIIAAAMQKIQFNAVFQSMYIYNYKVIFSDNFQWKKDYTFNKLRAEFEKRARFKDAECLL